MKGYWHIVALAVFTSIITIHLHPYYFWIAFFLWLFYLFYTNRLGKWPVALAIICFIFGLFYLSNDYENHIFEEDAKGIFYGEIVGPVKATDSLIEFDVKEEQTKSIFKLTYFQSEKEKANDAHLQMFKHGAHCKFKGKLQQVETATNPGQFDYAKHLKRSGIHGQIALQSMNNIHCEGHSALHHLYYFRATMMNYNLDEVPQEVTAWIHALIFGDTSLLDRRIIELFQDWGLSHVLAISGLHVGIIVAIIYFLLVKLCITTKEKAEWLLIFFLPIYALIAGGQPSVWRACLMVFIFLLFNKVKWKYQLTDIISIVFLLLLLLHPTFYLHIGFQFSFLVTFGLLLSKHWLHNTRSRLLVIIQISFVAQMMILPLQFIYFYKFQPLSILLNGIVVPYFSFFVIPFVFVMFILSPLPSVLIYPLYALFLSVQSFFLDCLEVVDHYVDFPMIIGNFPIVFVVSYFILFFYFMIQAEAKNYRLTFSSGILITLMLTSLIAKPYFSPYGEVTMLDIGQGDAFVIELPYRKGVIFVDAGASFSFHDMEPTDKVYRQIIKPFLYSKGIQHIDAIFLSHEHIDHIGSVRFLVEDFSVHQLYVSQFYQMNSDEFQLYKSNQVTLKRIQQNEIITIHNQPFLTLAPGKDKNDENENSLVLYTVLGKKGWLTGDVGNKENKPYHINVLKGINFQNKFKCHIYVTLILRSDFFKQIPIVICYFLRCTFFHFICNMSINL